MTYLSYPECWYHQVINFLPLPYVPAFPSCPQIYCFFLRSFSLFIFLPNSEPDARYWVDSVWKHRNTDFLIWARSQISPVSWSDICVIILFRYEVIREKIGVLADGGQSSYWYILMYFHQEKKHGNGTDSYCSIRLRIISWIIRVYNSQVVFCLFFYYFATVTLTQLRDSCF